MQRDAQKKRVDYEELTEEEKAELDEFLRAFREYSEKKASDEMKDTIGKNSTGKNGFIGFTPGLCPLRNP
jgi:uncharacterized protein (DUF4415 family)